MVYRFEGRQVWKRIGPNKKDADHFLAEVTSQINNGIYRLPDKMTFRDFAEKWLHDYAMGAVKESTYRNYKSTIEKILNVYFGNIFLSQITPYLVQRFVTKRLLECKAKTVHKNLTQLKNMLSRAKKWGFIRVNNAEEIDPPKVEHVEMDFLTPEEIRLLLKNSDEPYRALFLTAILTGMRRGELLGLQWGDIDFHSNSIYVRRSLYWQTKKEAEERGRENRWVFVTPKSVRSRRIIAMSPILKDTLEQYRLTCPISPLELVFCAKNGGPMCPDNMIHRKFLPALERAGLRKLRFHDLRHSYASLLVAQNENAKFIQSQLGHASIQTTMDRYAHLMPRDNKEVGAKLDKQVFGESANERLTNEAQTPENTAQQEQSQFSLN